MQYITCPHCGAHLDHGERCDCGGKGKEAALHHQELPQTKESIDSLPAGELDVKPFNLRALRLGSGASGKEMVKVVKELYPKYDKTLQSKCERGDEYGIELRQDAVEALQERFSPDRAITRASPDRPKKRQSRHGHHRLKRSIRCRLPDEIYAELVQRIRDDGSTVQAWMAGQVQHYLAEKRAIERSKS